jgi:hypothetical protein
MRAVRPAISSGSPARRDQAAESAAPRRLHMGWRAVWAAAAALMIVDAVLTYISVGHLGAVEVVLRPINDFPPLVFAVTVAKIGGLYYLYAKRYGWLNLGDTAVASGQTPTVPIGGRTTITATCGSSTSPVSNTVGTKLSGQLVTTAGAPFPFTAVVASS